MLLTARKSKIAQSPELPITNGEHRYHQLAENQFFLNIGSEFFKEAL
jgi:hypothetical protein